MNRKHRSAAFTLLELLVVLAILAIVTTLAVRSLDGVEDQRRYEANNELMRSLETAVLGEDGNDQSLGFVADMGRLPHAVGNGPFTLSELWALNGNPTFDVRAAAIDTDIKIASGWRGPYLRLPAGTDQLRDGWGNLFQSPDERGAVRLKKSDGSPISAPGQPVAIVSHFGANGTEGSTDDRFDKDDQTEFHIEAFVKASVEVLDSNGTPSIGTGTDKVIVRVFGPDSTNAAVVKVVPAGAPDDFVELSSSPISVPSSSASPGGIAGMTIGPRAVRAYLYSSDGSALIAKSAVKRIPLRPGVNFVTFTIRRP